MLGEDDAKGLSEVLMDIKGALKEFKDRRAGGSQVVHQHVNAGGHAVWVVVVMAAVIFTAAVQQGPRISDLERKVDRLEDYLSAIYQQVPELKAKVEQNVNDHNHHSPDGSESKQ